MDLKLLIITALMQIGTAFPVAGFASKYPTGQTYKYQYVTETLINEPDSSHESQAYRDVGLKFTGTVELTPVWNDNQQMLVRLSVSNPHAMLESVSRKDLHRTLKSLPKLPIYFQWSEGKVGEVYAAKEDSKLSINIKKGIISLFQLVNVDKQRKEVDASGNCEVKYVVEDKGKLITKSKTTCTTKDSQNYFMNVNPLMGLSTSVRAETKYTIKDDVIQTAQGIETVISRLNLKDSVAASVINRQEMTLQTTGRGPSHNGKRIPDVIRIINRAERIKLQETSLETEFEVRPCGSDCPKAQDVINKHREYLLPSNPATVETAYAFLDVVEALRDASKFDITYMLNNEENEEIIQALIDCVTAAQTNAGQQALLQFLDFSHETEITLPERYLLAVAFSTHPGENILKDLLMLHKKKVSNDKLQESITEAMGAVLNTYCRMHHCDTQIAKEVLKHLVQDLESCTDVKLKPMYLRALANAGIPETIPILLKYAETSKDITVSEEAVKGLRRMGMKEISKPEVRDSMKRIFLQKQRGFDTAIRSHALKYILATNITKDELREILLETTDPYNTDYALYIQARVFNLMEQNENIRKLGTEILKEEIFRNWNILAPKGKALAFTSYLAKATGTATQYFMYVENSKAGIMKRSGMDVDVLSGVQNLPVYNFGIFAAGIESLLGQETDSTEEVVATAGISLDLMDVSLRPITFFEGSSGLMSAVWSAPSEPMSALQTNILLHDHKVRFHLQNGLIMELDVQGTVSMDLSGSLSISLWNKNSKSLILSSGALAVRGSLKLVTSTFRSGLKFTADAASVINFQTDVDFYDGIKMCLQMYRPDVVFKHHVEKFEYARGFKKGYKARINRTNKSPAVCYPLPRTNNKQCRKLIVDEL